jgi:trk system potassium uptake protein TrkH
MKEVNFMAKKNDDFDKSIDVNTTSDKNTEFNARMEKAQLKYKKLAQKKQKREDKKQKRSLQKREANRSEIFKRLKNWWPLSKVSGKILLFYFLTVMIGGFLLSIPGIIVNKTNYWDFMSGVFTASSAFSDTGIVVLQTSSDFSFWGQLFIAIMIQIGGIGILTFKIVVFIIIGRKISINDQSIAQSERGNSILSNTVETIRDGFIFLTIVEVIGFFVLFFGFYFSVPSTDPNLIGESFSNPHENFGQSVWMAIFHSISAVNNAGFDILSKNSIMSYNVDGHRSYLIQVVFMMQWIIGGLGYPTFHDIKKKIKARRKGKTVKFSLFTKLNFYTYSVLLILGPVLTYVSELTSGTDSWILYQHLADGTVVHNKWYVSFMDIVFNVTASRNAGFSTVNINHFNAGSQSILSVWMFIGSAPSSTAGGIRTTTFAICCIGVISIMRNRQSVDAHKKKIPADTVRRAFAVFFLSAVIVFVATFIIYLDSKSAILNNLSQGEVNDIRVRNGDITIIQLLTLVCSAYGTVGFSPFNLAVFGITSKITLILVMFIGQLGVSNTLLAFIKPSSKQRFEYLEEDVVIG